MAGLMRRDPFEVLEPFRRLLEGGDLQAATPRVEEFREGSTVVIRAELPGIDPEADVELTVVDDTLRLRAERRERSEHRTKDGYRSEFHYGSFSRTLPLPAGCKEEDITATYTDGVLEVRAPVREQDERPATRRIPVRRTGGALGAGGTGSGGAETGGTGAAGTAAGGTATGTTTATAGGTATGTGTTGATPGTTTAGGTGPATPAGGSTGGPAPEGSIP